MFYYDGNNVLTEEQVAARCVPVNAKLFGILPLIENIPQYCKAIEGIVISCIEPAGDYYVRKWSVRAHTVSEMRETQTAVKQSVKSAFTVAFAEIDAKTRPMRGALLSVVDGTFPTQAYNADEPQKDLTPEQQQRIIDVGIMWELEEVAQVNRDMQTELLALEITEDMTLEQAQEITLRIANAKPWLPWRE